MVRCNSLWIWLAEYLTDIHVHVHTCVHVRHRHTPTYTCMHINIHCTYSNMYDTCMHTHHIYTAHTQYIHAINIHFLIPNMSPLMEPQTKVIYMRAWLHVAFVCMTYVMIQIMKTVSDCNGICNISIKYIKHKYVKSHFPAKFIDRCLMNIWFEWFSIKCCTKKNIFFLNPFIYETAANDSSVFNDFIDGYNRQCSFPATKVWDAVSRYESPNYAKSKAYALNAGKKTTKYVWMY